MGKHEDRVSFKHGTLPPQMIEKLRTYLSSVLEVDPNEYLCVEPLYSCFDNICLIFCLQTTHGVPVDALVYGNKWVGVVINNEPYLSLNIYEDVFRSKGYRASIVVSEKGCKAFLYGNDILRESIVVTYPPVNNPVAVIDSLDKKVIGVAIPHGDVYKNVYDLGLFIRTLK